MNEQLKQEIEAKVGSIVITESQDWMTVAIQYSGLGSRGELRHALIAATGQSTFDRAKKVYIVEQHPLNVEKMLRAFLEQTK